MKRLWPQSLAGQIIVGLLLVLVIAHGISFYIFVDERRLAARAAGRSQVLSRVASVVRLLDRAPIAARARIVDDAAGRRLRLSLDDENVARQKGRKGARKMLGRRLKTLLGDRDRPVRVTFPDDAGDLWGWMPWSAHHPEHHDDDGDRDDDDEHHDDDDDDDDHPRHRGLVMSVQLDDGRWLNASTLLLPRPPAWTLPSITAMGVTAVALVLLVVLLVRRTTRPLADLAVAAERLGRGEDVPPVPLDGPLDVRQTTEAFNRMNERLRRFLDDRTRMLAAVSHDLRTPITSLRLRAEFIDDEDLKARMLETLDEMQRMAEATLAFAREDATHEATRDVDMAALVESVCVDLADLGRDVVFAGAGRTPVACRTVAIKRALRNIIENAVSYGVRARVSLDADEDEVRLVVDDDGPGIPEADFERVFEPFARLEASRNADTGGIGLGLSIARTIAGSHGGDIDLANRADGGLRVTLRLPRRAAAA